MSTLTEVTVSNFIVSALKNNHVKSSTRLIDQLKYYILLQLFFGINRVYLLKYNRIVTIVCALYVLGISLSVLYFGIIFPPGKYITFGILKYSFLFVNFSLTIISLTRSKKKYENIFKILSEIDEKLNIQNDLDITSSLKAQILCFALVTLLINAGYAFLVLPKKFLYDPLLNHAIIFYISCAIDLEHIFFAIPVQLVYTRVIIIKAHIDKHCKVVSDDASDNLGKKIHLELLERHCEVSITKLHVLYEKLDKCSAVISDALSLPFLLTFLISGGTTIIFLNQLLNILQMPEINGITMMYGICLVLRCLKAVIQIVIPCFYSSQTTTEVASMRSTIHDYLNSACLVDKTERRKLKAFYYLIKEFNFDYNIYGLIRLNMSLPLKYINLCVTYFIIIVQFSKLIKNL